ncbi:MAG: hypothetical protein FWE36_03920 [Erysipelotrichales bacterium]|nr:hypothetical protein [Erysipelotrichales bacterium]
MDRIILKIDLVLDMIRLYEFKGKNFYYHEVFETNAEKIANLVINRDVSFFIKIFELDITEHRLKLILEKNATPKNKIEMFADNLRKSFIYLHSAISNFELLPNVIQDFANMIYKGVDKISYKEEITTTHLGLTERKITLKRNDLEELTNQFMEKLASKNFELTLLITNFYVDFINMQVFRNHNEEIGLILLYIMLFKEKFEPFRFASFFEAYFNNLAAYKKATMQASFNWEEGYSQTEPLNRQIIKTLLECYQKIEHDMEDYLFDQNIKKRDFLENAIINGKEIFTKEELVKKFPYVSISTIDKTLKRLKDENKIRPLGTGRSAKWIRLVKPPEKFRRENYQFTIDDFANEETA